LVSARTARDYSVSSNGNPSTGGVKPRRTPNVDGEISYVPDDLINVKTNAISVLM